MNQYSSHDDGLSSGHYETLPVDATDLEVWHGSLNAKLREEWRPDLDGVLVRQDQDEMVTLLDILIALAGR